MADLARGTGSGTRLAIATQVVLVVLLAALAAGLATWLAGRPGLRVRWDATAANRNTLDPVLAGIVERLPERVTIEVFFRPVPGPAREAVQDAQQRMGDLLLVARNRYPELLSLIEHDLSDLSRAGRRLQELGVQGDNVVVVLRGDQKVVLRLERDLARFDPGNAVMKVAPRLESFLGDEALGEALLAVTRGEAPSILFSTGHGERDPFDTEVGGLGQLQSALAADGFSVGTWDPGLDASIPASCDVLALVDPLQPIRDEVLDEVRRYVEGGGRLFVVPSHLDATLDGPGTLGALLRGLGIVVQPGYVAQMRPNAMGQMVQGQEENAILFVPNDGFDARHEVTESLRRLGAQLPNVAASRAFSKGTTPTAGRLDALVVAPPDTWCDLPDARGKHDWRFDAERERPRGPIVLAMALEFPPRGVDAGERGEDGEPLERKVARVVAFGSAEAMGNGPFQFTRDFLLNSFNWLTERDWRLNVRPRDPDRRRIDLVNTNALAVINRVATLGLPALVALLGIVVAWRRRR